MANLVNILLRRLGIVTHALGQAIARVLLLPHLLFPALLFPTLLFLIFVLSPGPSWAMAGDQVGDQVGQQVGQQVGISPWTLLAQTSTPSTPEPILNRLGVEPGSIPSEKINQFVRACLQVVALIDKREGQLQGAETETESVRIEQEIETEAIAIIEQAGLTRQEYLQLLGLANTDPEFGERIAIQLQEAVN
jgi:hypothetical protein